MRSGAVDLSSVTPKDLRDLIAKGGRVVTAQEPPTVEETVHYVANYGFGTSGDGNPVLAFNVPAAGGQRRVAFPFSPLALDQYIEKLREFRASLDAASLDATDE